jgi:hypothetical protein
LLAAPAAVPLATSRTVYGGFCSSRAFRAARASSGFMSFNRRRHSPVVAFARNACCTLCSSKASSFEMLGKLIQHCLCFVGQQALYPVGVDWHWSVSSVIERETDTPSLEIAETRCPGVQRTTVIVFGGSSVPVVDDTWGAPESTSAIRHPPGRCNQAATCA